MQFSSSQETAVCTLSSVSLPKFVRERTTFDFDALHKTVKLAVRNTDRLLDLGVYPSGESACSVNNTRATGVGVQGLADVFMALRIPYGSQQAKDLNIKVFETVYHASLDASCALAETHGTYWAGSPASLGTLYVDMWPSVAPHLYDFQPLRERIAQHGLLNALLTAQIPTASTSYLMGNTPGVEPYAR